MSDLIKTSEYKDWLKNLKLKFQQAQIKAAVKVNTTLLAFYWELGADIVEKQKTAKWGSGFLPQLSRDLMAEFPDIKGFSYQNLKHVRRWYLFYNKAVSKRIATCYPIANQATSQLGEHTENLLLQIPWWHNVVIISKCKNTEEALFYVSKTPLLCSRGTQNSQIQTGIRG